MASRKGYLLTTNKTSKRTLFAESVLKKIGFDVVLFQHIPHKEPKVSNKISMISIYQTILESDDEYGYVFEDDVNILEDITLEEITQYEKISPMLFYLGLCPFPNNKTIKSMNLTINSHEVFNVAGEVCGLHGIGISKTGIKSLLEFLKVHDDPNRCLDELVGGFTSFNPAPIVRFDLECQYKENRGHRGIMFQDREHFPSIIDKVSFLEQKYNDYCIISSDISEHMPVLREYSAKCNHITETGVRAVTSSYAFAAGLLDKPNARLIQIDLNTNDAVKQFSIDCKKENISVVFYQQSDLECPIEQTDLLFIDTWHIYGQLKRELARWNTFVSKYIIMHDTTVDEWYGETLRQGGDCEKESRQSGIPLLEIKMGLWPAIVEFLSQHPEWVLEKRFTNNNGLTILRRL